MNSEPPPPNSHSLQDKHGIRQQRIRVFNAFTKRALAIVDDDKSLRGTLADASRLVETALQAIQHNNATDQSADEDPDRRFFEDIARIYDQTKDQTG